MDEFRPQASSSLAPHRDESKSKQEAGYYNTVRAKDDILDLANYVEEIDDTHVFMEPTLTDQIVGLVTAPITVPMSLLVETDETSGLAEVHMNETKHPAHRTELAPRLVLREAGDLLDPILHAKPEPVRRPTPPPIPSMRNEVLRGSLYKRTQKVYPKWVMRDFELQLVPGTLKYKKKDGTVRYIWLREEYVSLFLMKAPDGHKYIRLKWKKKLVHKRTEEQIHIKTHELDPQVILPDREFSFACTTPEETRKWFDLMERALFPKWVLSYYRNIFMKGLKVQKLYEATIWYTMYDHRNYLANFNDHLTSALPIADDELFEYQHVEVIQSDEVEVAVPAPVVEESPPEPQPIKEVSEVIDAGQYKPPLPTEETKDYVRPQKRYVPKPKPVGVHKTLEYGLVSGLERTVVDDVYDGLAYGASAGIDTISYVASAGADGVSAGADAAVGSVMDLGATLGLSSSASASGKEADQTEQEASHWSQWKPVKVHEAFPPAHVVHAAAKSKASGVGVGSEAEQGSEEVKGAV